MPTDDVERQWSELTLLRSPAKKYFDPDSPLELLFGSDDRGRAVMALLTDEDLALEDLSRDVSTRAFQRDDGRWATTWTLHDSSLFPTFVRLAVDLADQSAHPIAPRTALDEFRTTLAQWQVLLRPRPPKRLTLEKLRGLVGELWAGEEVVLEGRARAEIVRAWSGPLGGVHDFTFPSGEAWEIKAKRTKATVVKVSSAEQLDPSDRTLNLVVLDLDERSRDVDGARSLVDLVASWHEALSQNPAERHLFDLLITRLGVDLSDHYYEDTCFTLQRIVRYRVEDDFPTLRAAALPEAVSAVRYQFDVRGLDDWIVTDGGRTK